MDILRVVIKYPGHEPFEAVIPNTLDVMQSIVGGYIEHVAVDNNLHIVCNETGVLDNLKRNTAVFCYGEPMTIFGPVIFMYEGGEAFASLDTDGVIAAMQMVEDGKDAMVEMWEVV